MAATGGQILAQYHINLLTERPATEYTMRQEIISTETMFCLKQYRGDHYSKSWTRWSQSLTSKSKDNVRSWEMRLQLNSRFLFIHMRLNFRRHRDETDTIPQMGGGLSFELGTKQKLAFRKWEWKSWILCLAPNEGTGCSKAEWWEITANI